MRAEIYHADVKKGMKVDALQLMLNAIKLDISLANTLCVSRSQFFSSYYSCWSHKRIGRTADLGGINAVDENFIKRVRDWRLPDGRMCNEKM